MTLCCLRWRSIITHLFSQLIPSQKVIDISNGHSLTVFLILLLKLLNPHDVVIFLTNQILHIQHAKSAAFLLLLLLVLVLLGILKGALKVFLAIIKTLHLLFLQLLRRSCTLQFKFFQLEESFFFADSIEEAVGLVALGFDFGDIVPIDSLTTLPLLKRLQTLLWLLKRILRHSGIYMPLLLINFRLFLAQRFPHESIRFPNRYLLLRLLRRRFLRYRFPLSRTRWSTWLRLRFMHALLSTISFLTHISYRILQLGVHWFVEHWDFTDVLNLHEGK